MVKRRISPILIWLCLIGLSSCSQKPYYQWSQEITYSNTKEKESRVHEQKASDLEEGNNEESLMAFLEQSSPSTSPEKLYRQPFQNEGVRAQVGTWEVDNQSKLQRADTLPGEEDWDPERFQSVEPLEYDRYDSVHWLLTKPDIHSRWDGRRKTTPFAWISAISAFSVFLFLAIGAYPIAIGGVFLAIISGHIALRQIRNDKKKWKGGFLAFLGLIFGYAFAMILLLLLLIIISFSSTF